MFRIPVSQPAPVRNDPSPAICPVALVSWGRKNPPMPRGAEAGHRSCAPASAPGAATPVVDANVRPAATGVWTTTLSVATVSRLSARTCLLHAVPHGQGSAGGAGVSDTYVFVYKMRDGLTVEGWEYKTKQEALEAAGLSG